MKSSPKAGTLLFLEDPGVAELLAFCVDAFTVPAPSAAYTDKSRILLQVETYSRWRVSAFHYWKCLLTGLFTRKKAKVKSDFKAY